MHNSKVLDVSYGQIAVFNSMVVAPFSLWEDRHVHQGFTWREGAAGFRTLEESGSHRVEVITSKGCSAENCVLSIDVPFFSQNGVVVVASIGDEFDCRIEVGSYQLRYECSPDRKISLQWMPCAQPVFRVNKLDRLASGAEDLSLVAYPAE